MCKDCKETTWEISETENVFEETTLSFLESQALDFWKEIVEAHSGDEIASFLSQIVEVSVSKRKPVSIHPLIGRFCETYEKILFSKKKFVFFEHFCLIAFSKGQ